MGPIDSFIIGLFLGFLLWGIWALSHSTVRWNYVALGNRENWENWEIVSMVPDSGIYWKTTLQEVNPKKGKEPLTCQFRGRNLWQDVDTGKELPVRGELTNRLTALRENCEEVRRSGSCFTAKLLKTSNEGVLTKESFVFEVTDSQKQETFQVFGHHGFWYDMETGVIIYSHGLEKILNGALNKRKLGI